MKTEQKISRRTVAKGAAWSVPVVAAAAAAPAASASTTPTCPTCLTMGSGTFVGNVTTVAGAGLITGTDVFNVNSTACDLSLFQPAYTVVGLGGTVTLSNGTTFPYTVGATTGAGSFGQISAFTSTYTSAAQVTLPNGGGILGRYPVVPTKISFGFTALFVGLPDLISVSCPYQVTYNISNVSTTGAIVAGTGTLVWTGTFTNGTVTPG